MSLKTQIEADVASVFLDTDDFADSCIYTPKDGAARTVTAVVDRSTRIEQDSAGIWQLRVAAAFVSKASDGTGIESIPKLGSSLQLGDDIYAFEGTVTDEDESSMTLEFVIREPLRRGGNWMGR